MRLKVVVALSALVVITGLLVAGAAIYSRFGQTNQHRQEQAYINAALAKRNTQSDDAIRTVLCYFVDHAKTSSRQGNLEITAVLKLIHEPSC